MESFFKKDKIKEICLIDGDFYFTAASSNMIYKCYYDLFNKLVFKTERVDKIFNNNCDITSIRINSRIKKINIGSNGLDRKIVFLSGIIFEIKVKKINPSKEYTLDNIKLSTSIF